MPLFYLKTVTYVYSLPVTYLTTLYNPAVRSVGPQKRKWPQESLQPYDTCSRRVRCGVFLLAAHRFSSPTDRRGGCPHPPFAGCRTDTLRRTKPDGRSRRNAVSSSQENSAHLIPPFFAFSVAQNAAACKAFLHETGNTSAQNRENT